MSHPSSPITSSLPSPVTPAARTAAPFAPSRPKQGPRQCPLAHAPGAEDRMAYNRLKGSIFLQTHK